YPLQVIYSKSPLQTGVWLGPGSLTFANAAVGAGAVVLVSGATTISIPLAGGESALGVADKGVGVLGGVLASGAPQNASADLPLTAGKNVGGVLPIYYAPSRNVRRPNCNISTSTGTTVLFTGGAATDGTGNLSHPATFAGIAGA